MAQIFLLQKAKKRKIEGLAISRKGYLMKKSALESCIFFNVSCIFFLFMYMVHGPYIRPEKKVTLPSLSRVKNVIFLKNCFFFSEENITVPLFRSLRRDTLPSEGAEICQCLPSQRNVMHPHPFPLGKCTLFHSRAAMEGLM